MSATTVGAGSPAVASRSASAQLRTDPAYQAFTLLRIGFTVAPILFGLDKFANVMVDWSQYLAPWINDIIPGSADQFMYAVGVVEIVAGIVVAIRPRYGAYLVAAWLGGIIFNLVTYSGYYDIALRDFGLMLGALTLARLSEVYDRVAEQLLDDRVREPLLPRLGGPTALPTSRCQRSGWLSVHMMSAARVTSRPSRSAPLASRTSTIARWLT